VVVAGDPGEGVEAIRTIAALVAQMPEANMR